MGGIAPRVLNGGETGKGGDSENYENTSPPRPQMANEPDVSTNHTLTKFPRYLPGTPPNEIRKESPQTGLDNSEEAA